MRPTGLSHWPPKVHVPRGQDGVANGIYPSEHLGSGTTIPLQDEIAPWQPGISRGGSVENRRGLCTRGSIAMIVNTAELNSLVNGLLPFAQHMLQEHDAFLPFAAIVKSGEVVMLAAGLEDPNAPVPQRLDNIRKALSRHASNAGCSAVAYCVHIKLSDLRDGTATDAVQIAFEHRSGEALDVVFTYTKTGDSVEFAQPMVRLAAGGLFAVTAGSFVN